MTFVEFHSIENPVLVNLDNVETIQNDNLGVTKVYFVGGIDDWQAIDESLDEVKRIIEGVRND